MAEKICGIYKITNTVNGKVYIGQSIDIFTRWKKHRIFGRPSNTSNPEHKYPLYMAMRKYGIDNFEFEIIEQCAQNDLNDIEEKYIRQYNSDSSDYGYNCRKQFHSTGKLSVEDVQQIYMLLSSTSFTMSDIAGIVKVATTVISKINQGKLHYNANQSYPIRSREQTRKLSSINKRLSDSDGYIPDEIRYQYDIDTLYTQLIKEKKISSKTRKITPDELAENQIKEIIELIETTGLTFPEIADMYCVPSKTISKINRGESYVQQREYPIRTASDIHFINYISKYFLEESNEQRRKQSLSVLIAKYTDIYEQGASKKTCSQCGDPIGNTKNGLCRKCYDAKISANRGLPEEDVNFSLIERILDTSLEAVAKEYGYTSGNAVKKILKNHGLPFMRSDMLDYYEQQTGHRHHKVQQKEERKEATRQHNKHYAPRKVAQYDRDGNLINIYPSTKEATRQSGVANSSITRCCNGMAWQAGGFLWFYLDQEGNSIRPGDVATHHWNTRCDICGGDTDSLVDDICPRCAENRRSFDKSDFTLEQLTDLLNEYPLTQLAKLLSCDPKTIYGWFARYGINKEEVRKMNRDRS